jgi:hypothetical protein
VHQVGDNEYYEVGSGLPLESENLVEFHLLYEGPLHSGSDKKEAHAIRKVFHRQLRRLWETNPSLIKRAHEEGFEVVRRSVTQGGMPILPPNELWQKGVEQVGRNWDRHGFNFVPLVTESTCLRCRLEILFLRMEEKNYVLQGGDIDGRIKILFDSLRIVKERSQLPAGDEGKPSADEAPFFCLLEDDGLISDVRINTDSLLLLPKSKPSDKSDVHLQITVQLNPTRLTRDSWMF